MHEKVSVDFYEMGDGSDGGLSFATQNQSPEPNPVSNTSPQKEDDVSVPWAEKRGDTVTPGFGVDAGKGFEGEKSLLSEMSKAVTAKTVQSSNFEEVSISRSMTESEEESGGEGVDDVFEDLAIPQHFDIDETDSDEEDGSEDLARDMDDQVEIVK